MWLVCPGPFLCTTRIIPATQRPASLVRTIAGSHTLVMRVLAQLAIVGFSFGLAVSAAQADEIRLKDGKKLYGVIVAYEDNMFKVKTDYGYVLVEKDKIAAIVPNTPATNDGKAAPQPAKSEPASQPAKSDPPSSSSSTPAETKEASAKTKIANANVRPS